MKECCSKYHTPKAKNGELFEFRELHSSISFVLWFFYGDSQDTSCIYYDLNDAERAWHIQRYYLELSPK